MMSLLRSQTANLAAMTSVAATLRKQLWCDTYVMQYSDWAPTNQMQAYRHLSPPHRSLFLLRQRVPVHPQPIHQGLRTYHHTRFQAI